MTASQPPPPGRTTLDMLSAEPRMMETDSPGGEHSANTADNCMTSPPRLRSAQGRATAVLTAAAAAAEATPIDPPKPAPRPLPFSPFSSFPSSDPPPALRHATYPCRVPASRSPAVPPHGPPDPPRAARPRTLPRTQPRSHTEHGPTRITPPRPTTLTCISPRAHTLSHAHTHRFHTFTFTFTPHPVHTVHPPPSPRRCPHAPLPRYTRHTPLLHPPTRSLAFPQLHAPAAHPSHAQHPTHTPLTRPRSAVDA